MSIQIASSSSSGSLIFPLRIQWLLFYSHGEDVQSVHRAPHHLEVVLEDGDSAGQGLMSAAAEQSHTRVQQDGGYKRRVRDPAQAFDAALEASWQHTDMEQKILNQLLVNKEKRQLIFLQ